MSDARWNAIAARIEAFLDSIRMWSSYHSSTITAGTERPIYDQGRDVIKAIEAFRQSPPANFPAAALAVLSNSRMQQFANAEDPGMHVRSQFVAEMGVTLAAMLADARYHLSDLDEILRLTTDRALLHLQWTITADPEARTKWQSALSSGGEQACEALGAVHLLGHGIFAFKAHSARARTDLVFKEPVSSDQAATAEGLVLTEWKIAHTAAEASKKIDDAQVQADNYAAGVLGGAELVATRYIIVVSEQQLVLPPAAARSGYSYKHVNIAVDPVSPSHASAALRSSLK